MGQGTSSFLGRKGTCDGIKEARDPVQDIFSVSASEERTDSTDSSGTLVGLVYM
jgi:hypothetical protein